MIMPEQITDPDLRAERMANYPDTLVINDYWSKIAYEPEYIKSCEISIGVRGPYVMFFIERWTDLQVQI